MRWLSSSSSSCSSSSSSSLPLLLLLLLSSLSVLLSRESVSGFRICSYNVHRFNQRKAEDYRVIHTLTRVIYRYDICLLQNVDDPDGKAVQALLRSINRYNKHVYKSVSSKPLGKSGDKEQYVFIFKSDTVHVMDRYQYETKPPNFVREPFAVQFQGLKTLMKRFVLIPLHSDPPHAVQEMDRLFDVFTKVSQKWNNPNVMFLGDFHAGCSHMSRSDKKKIRLFTNSSFSWLIGDKVDTTISEDTSCAYDRIVVHGKPFLKMIEPLSAKVYDFGKDLKMSRSKVLDVSDHLPVEVKLKSPALLLQATPLLLLLSFSSFIHFLV